jgi:dienelactone hydrolase
MRLASSLALILGLALTAPLLAPRAADAAGIGIVLLHARGSWPGQFDGVAPKLQAAGYATVAPEACWSVHRIYQGTVDQCQVDIDKAIATLKSGGADQIVLAGNDMGGMDALYYAGGHTGLAGIVAWGPRDVIRLPGDSDLTDAFNMVQAGNGDKRGNFNNGRMYATANQLLSWEGPNSPFADPAALVSKISVPMLWMAANDDLGPRDPTDLFNRAHPNPLNTLVWSKSDEFDMIDVSIDDVIAWLGKLKAATTIAK